MKKTSLVLTTILVCGLSACSKKSDTEAANPAAVVQTATVKLKDGGSFSGKVKTSDATAITLEGENGEVRTYPMTQVASVQYGSSVPAPPASQLSPAPPKVDANSSPASAAKAVPQPVQPATPPAPRFELATVPAGTTLEVRNNEAIDSTTARSGQSYTAVLTRDLMDDQGRVAAPKGANATLVVRAATDQGKVQGRSELSLDVASIEVDGRSYRVETKDLVERGKQGVGTNKRTATYTGGGAAVGSIIGAIVGGGKGAAIGALSGAGAGAGVQAVTRGKAVRVPSETVLRFTLEQPVQIRLVP